MLLPSDRHTAADLEVWRRHLQADARAAQVLAGRLDRLADQARQVIADFATLGPCTAQTSWGKDSTVLAHLLATSAPTVVDIVPLVYATSATVPGRTANPDSPAVRDAFLAAHPNVRYMELGGGLASIGRHFGTERRITGVRGAESTRREKSARRHGVGTDTSCRPIIGWADLEVWAYLHLHDLPIHPAYAMSYGGALDRSRIRVHSFGGADGATYGRLKWEDHYYPDITAPLVGRTAARPG